MCQCNCKQKTRKEVAQRILRSGESQSCGCLRFERCLQAVTKHNMYKTPEYRAWQHIKDRCLNSKTKGYKNYGGRGIKVCDRWLNSFVDFLSDIGQRPSSKLSVDRKDNNGHYSCGKCKQCLTNHWNFNCRWATSKEQAENKRNSGKARVTFDQVIEIRKLRNENKIARKEIAKKFDITIRYVGQIANYHVRISE